MQINAQKESYIRRSMRIIRSKTTPLWAAIAFPVGLQADDYLRICGPAPSFLHQRALYHSPFALSRRDFPCFPGRYEI